MERSRITGYCSKCEGWRWFQLFRLVAAEAQYQCENCNDWTIYRKR